MKKSRVHEQAWQQGASVTGAGRGIGRAIALELAREGASVVVNDLDSERVSETANAIRAEGASAHVVSDDVTEPDSGDRIIPQSIEAFSGIDIIVNDADDILNTTIQKNTGEQW